jgi:hypothetical protein
MNHILLITFLIVSSTSVLGATPTYDRVIGVCHLSESPFVPKSAVNTMAPSMETKDYYRKKEHYKIEGQANISVLKMPEHGEMKGPVNEAFVYYPDKGYIGNDHASLSVEVGGKMVRVEYFFRVMQSIPQQYESEPDVYEQGYCPKKARVWRISSTHE